MLGRAFSRVYNVVKYQRRTISEYAKSYGYKPRPLSIPEPRVNPFAIGFCYSASIWFMYEVIQDRKLHHKTFIEHRQEGKEYLELTLSLNHFIPFHYDRIDEFLGRNQPEYQQKEYSPWKIYKKAMIGLTFKDDPDVEWKEDDTSYLKK